MKFFLADWCHCGGGTALKWPTRPPFSAANLTTHDSHFELTVGILPSWIKGQNFHLPPPINRDGFHSLKEEKLVCKVGKKIIFFPSFSPFPLGHHFGKLLRHASTVIVVTNHSLVFPATLRTPPAAALLQQASLLFLFLPKSSHPGYYM
jgi:hypothetical protein